MWAEHLVQALREQACQGKTAAIQQAFDRIDGILQPILEGPVLDLEAMSRAMKVEDERIDAERVSEAAAKVPR